MRRNITILLTFFVLKGFSSGFMSYDSTRFNFATGMSFSTNNIRRDVTNTPYPGIDGKFQLFLTNSMRISAEYSHIFKHDMGMLWTGVQSNLFELNFQYIASIDGHESGFYTITGLAVQNWTGVYTGMGHEYEFRQYGNPQSFYSASWPTLSLGCGLQRSIKKVELYGEFKYRLSKRDDNVPLSILDVSYSLGLRYHIKVNPGKSGSGHRRSFIRMPGDRYHWF